MVMEDSAMIERISRGQDLMSHGDREGACTLYNTLWEEATRDENQYQLCVIAHFMAHAHTDAVMQRDWHLRSLRAADLVGDERVRGYYPSLYANLGEVHLRLGDLAQAWEYTNKAREVAYLLPDDGYGRLIRSLIERLVEAIGK